ncbi:deoxyguanosinetriphosphate triphosphohydrolase [Clostridium estertheticum]|uniref:Deoxyguanosinetriphosphate triphosphohydrolase n=1 Tax=Clostridium estertheticum subsp. estertheticum TaxID=1552 RepID=A0A1J0GK89_9CLOT|nr:deoxyguanosinetriphosphate triphosphohydrolase [Clostridium estertheticum]APC41294.1 deoxyguanosinetriphosphate triphosphohydrolase [Clostridium estertheticum subsp. estertheticum]MBU3172845.1 deoxyguanosinetriphosphate triphosphohydrolase [Clostridium estertheticum]MBZ9616872.1 deoxyguanosinetriphosphate triphosphohydrolase [Clostridium estertheticum subsp. laramiense]WAG72576.1 deoxyguanosinetriphosphate triphosphohydrolase [Clostridium estertheticum]
MNIRSKIETNESSTIIQYGALSINSKGREKMQEKDDLRTCYMVDRDRIIHSKSFRRLKHKTQVYIKTSSDHYRTRLTHTLEVAQIARTIGRGIGLNEDLIEAIALGHDIGHVPFAHNGEAVLNDILPKGFRHNENSIRVLTKIEKAGVGLNLSIEVLDGILNHSGLSEKFGEAATLEGQVVRYSDKIAYVNHDIDDSIRAHLLTEEMLPKGATKVLGTNHGKRIDILVKDCIYNTINNLDTGVIGVSLTQEVGNALGDLRNFMFENIYKGEILKEERKKAQFVVTNVFEYYYKNPSAMPEFYKGIVEDEGLYIGVADYISGMSDDYCLMLFNNIYVPKLSIY